MKIFELSMDKKKFCYDKNTRPEVEIDSGDIVVFESDDANCGLIKSENDIWPEFKEIYDAAGGCNPVTGPVFVKNAHPGDCIAVEILKINPGHIVNGGYTSVQSGIGCLENINGTLQKPLDPAVRICSISNGLVHMKNENGEGTFEIPLRPCVGSIGVAPKYDRRASLFQGPEWFGNVDIPDITEGTTVILPVNVEGALLWLGDIHACQGDGEITGCALECQGKTMVKVTVMSREEAGFISCPQVNSPEWIGSVGMPFCSDMTAALRIGYSDLVHRLNKYYGISQNDAYMLLGLAGRVTEGNEFTCLCRIDRKVFSCNQK